MNSKPLMSSIDPGSYGIVANADSIDDDDDEEVEIKISASGSVLTPSSSPYDKFSKLKQANAQLMASELPDRPPAKVRFNDAVITATDTEEGLQNITSVEKLKSAPSSKILLVTVPTGFSEDVEEINSDEEIVDETDLGPVGPTDKLDDCRESSPKLRKALAFKEYSVDIKSMEEDGEEVVEESTTTLVSLCRMTSECDDTSLENNISKFEKLAIQSNCDDVPEVDEDSCDESDEDPSDELSVKYEENHRKSPVNDMLLERKIFANRSSGRATSARVVFKETKFTFNGNDKYDVDERPSTSPAKRVCYKNQWAYAKLPSYNGLRSEYGLSAEQLHERKRKRLESAKMQRQRKDEMYREEKKRQKENEQMFANWLVKKRKEAAMKAARRKHLQSAFYFKTMPAPISHLEKMGVLRKKVLARREHTCYSLEEFFKTTKPHEQKTYKIYLGLCVE